MLSEQERDAVGRMLKPLQIIIGALMFGLSAYTAFVLPSNKGVPREGSANMAPMAAVFAATCVAAAIVVPRIIGAKQRAARVDRELTPLPGMPASSVQSREAGALLADYQVRRIVAGALLEAPGFFNAVAYQEGQEPYSLGIIAALLFALALLIPTRGRLERWLEDELRTVRELRQLRG
jgi:hypothetical protein